MSHPDITAVREQGPHQQRSSRKYARIRKAALVVAGAVAVAVPWPGSAVAAPPTVLPSNATADEWKWLPAFDYDTDSCYPSVAIGTDGTLNGGLKPTGSVTGNCRTSAHLNNTNSYSRVKCNNGWCAYMYALYFEKDQASPGIGHRHDWECVVVWVQNDQAKYVSTSAHGDFKTYTSDKVRWSGPQAKIVYHKDGASTHAFRLAGSNDEPPENANHRWERPPLVGWNGYRPEWLRDKLSNANWGKANFPLKDANFGNNLNKSKPSGIPFNPYV